MVGVEVLAGHHRAAPTGMPPPPPKSTLAANSSSSPASKRISVDMLVNSNPLAQLAMSAASLPSMPAPRDDAQIRRDNAATLVSLAAAAAAALPPSRAPSGFSPTGFTPYSMFSPYSASSSPYHPSSASLAPPAPPSTAPIVRHFCFVNESPLHDGACDALPATRAHSRQPSPSSVTTASADDDDELDGDLDYDDASPPSSCPSPDHVVSLPVTVIPSPREAAEAVRRWWASDCAEKWALPVCPWPECGTAAAQPKQLIAHIVEHLHRDYSRCPFCAYRQEGKKFKLLSHLQRHIAAAHKCRCGATFSQVQALMRHRRELRCPLKSFKQLDKTKSRKRIAIGQLVD